MSLAWSPAARQAVPRFPASHPIPPGAVPHFPVSHPSNAPAAASLPPARFFCRGSAVSAHLSREGRRLLAMLEQSTIFQKGMGFGGHRYSEKPRKTFLPMSPALAGVWPLTCRFRQTQSALGVFQTTLSSKHRFCSVGTSLPWHRKAAAQSPRDSSAALPKETPLGPSAAAFSLRAILIPPPQGHRLLPRHPQPDLHNRQIILRSVKQNPLYIYHPTSIPEPRSTITCILPCTERDGQMDPPWVSHGNEQLEQTCSSGLKTLFHPISR